MRIDFKTLHIEGFMSIGEADINLTEGGFILVSGVNRCAQDLAKSNGSGKCLGIYYLVFNGRYT